MKIAVFCSSSNQIDPKYLDLASQVGKAIGESGHTLVFGGSNVGMMLSCAEAAKNVNGSIIGVIPELIYNKGHFYAHCDELIHTKDMHERKSTLTEISDAFVILPGGIGTMDEFFAVITLQQLKYIAKPLVVFNYDSYYSEILQYLSKSVDEKFSRQNLFELFRVVTEVDELIPAIERPQADIVEDKWL
jgi:uncharacterized protein (TIGR00730 family)